MANPGSRSVHGIAPTAGDVTAVVLTLGEPMTGRALASVRRQTAAPAQVLVVDGVTPFYRALNTAAARVQTPFFVQVDADMVLDVECLADLRGHMESDVGAAVGPLDDPLVGRAQGVKMFRRSCFDAEQVPDSISPDTDFMAALERRGWRVLHLTGLRAGTWRSPVFGRHQPALTPRAAYETYYLLGGRYRYLRDVAGLVWRMGRLRHSRHPVALMALLAIGHGLFLRREDDVPKSHAPQSDVDFLEHLLASDGEFPAVQRELTAARALPPKSAFDHSYELGRALGRASAGRSVGGCVRLLDRTGPRSSWVAEVGLYHGLLSADGTRRQQERDWETVEALIEPAPAGRPGAGRSP